MQRIHLLHYQEDIHLHQLEMQIALDIQTSLIGTNSLLVVNHQIKPEIIFWKSLTRVQPHVDGIPNYMHGGNLSKVTTSHPYQNV